MKKLILTFLQNHWDAILASVIACIAIYYLTRVGGIGLSPDSVEYYVSAINIRERGALIGFNEFPMVDFPAGYPIFLAINYFLTGIKPVNLAPLLNCFLYTGVIFLCSCIMQSFSGINRWYRIAFFILIAISPCLWEIYSMLWSETLYLLLILLFLLYWENYAIKKTDFSVLVLAVIAAVTFVTRFAGITIVATGAALILFDGSLALIKKIKQLFLFLLIGFSLVVINLIRNSHVSGTLSGVREKALRTLGDNLLAIGAVLGNWFPFIGEHYVVGGIVFILLVCIAALQIIYRVIQQQFYLKNETAVYGFFLVYSIFIVAVSTISRFEDLSSRLLSPIYIPMIWIATIWIPKFIYKRTRVVKNVLVLIVAILFLIFFKFQYTQNALNWQGIASAGIPGYSEKQWIESATIKYIKAHKDTLNGVVYSDADDGLYYLTGVKSLTLPHKEIEGEKKEFLSHQSLIVVWFNDGINTDLIDLDFINARKKLVLTKAFDDGAIYFYTDSLSAKK